MANKDTIPESIPEFTLEDIMKEFGSGDLDLDTPAESLGDTQVFTPVTQEDLEAHRAAEETEASAEVEKASAEEPELPVEAEETPAEEPEAPVAAEETPAEEPEAPVAAEETPAEEPEAPVEAEETPAEEPEAPVEAEETPAEEPEPPVDAEDAPAEAVEEAAAEEAEGAPADPLLSETQIFTPVTVEDLLAEPEEASAEEEAPAEEAVPAGEEEAASEEAAEEVEEEAPEEALPEEPAVPKPILFRSRLAELKRKLVAGPEKRYYDLTEVGLGGVQIAIFLSLLVVALCAGSTVLYAMGAVLENRLRLMIFSQILAMMVSALLGCYLLMDGILDLFTGKFSLNTMVFLTLAACAADALFCLKELRVPCCAAFSLEMTFALWNRSLRRSTEMGQMDTLRKAVRLDSLVKVKNFLGEKDGIVRTEGKLEDFMDHYNKPTGPEKVLNIYALISVLLCIGIAVLAGIRHGLSLAVQVFSTSMLVAVPACAFISQSRPAAILERRLHMVGTVICGWQGVKALRGKAAFPLTDRDIFPLGSIKLNGVKFLGDMDPDTAIAYAAALMRANGGGLEPVMTQLLRSRNGFFYLPEDVQLLSNGVSATIKGQRCVLALREYLDEREIEIPENALVDQAIYFLADDQLQAVFALNYARTKASAGGLVTLNSYRKLRPMVLADNFMINASLIREKFGIKAKRYDFPDRELRAELAAFQPDPELVGAALTTQSNLSSAAYAVTGAKALYTASRLGMWLSIFAGVVGLLIMAVLAYLGDMQLLSPFNILLYQLVWLIPGLLLTEWTRTV